MFIVFLHYVRFNVLFFLSCHVGYSVFLDSVFFFFSSRRRHTRLVSDWSSNVCSSDLTPGSPWMRCGLWPHGCRGSARSSTCPLAAPRAASAATPKSSVRGSCAASRRSEERRVGKEGRSRGSWER